jgi:hypothetical protein
VSMSKPFTYLIMILVLVGSACGQSGDAEAPMPPVEEHAHLIEELPGDSNRLLERGDEENRVFALYHEAVPDHWEARITPEMYGIEGSTSYAYSPRTIYLAEYHLNSSDRYLQVIIAHEYGHLIAFKYGTGEYLGAPPEGWPPRTDRPEEHWADCVQQVFLGFAEPTRGLPPCEGEQLSWASEYLAR